MTIQELNDVLERLLDENGVVDTQRIPEGKEDNKNNLDGVAENVGAYGVPDKKQGEYTLEDYYAIPDDRRVELIDGVIYDMTAPRLIHQSLIGMMYLQIADYLRKEDGPCRVFLSPCDVQLDCDNKTMVEPDLIILCDPSKMRGFGLFGAPDFLLEVLSKSTRQKDMYIKLNKYMAAGVREYWMLDIKNRKLIVFNFMDKESLPEILPLEGKKGLAIYNGECEIDLDAIRKEIEVLDID